MQILNQQMRDLVEEGEKLRHKLYEKQNMDKDLRLTRYDRDQNKSGKRNTELIKKFTASHFTGLISQKKF